MRLHYDPRSAAASLTMLIAASLGSIQANAEGPDKLKESDRWSPSLSVTLAMTIQDVEGYVSSTNDTQGTQLRPTSEGDKVMLSPQGGGTLEIMSPSLPIPLGPRIFFDGELDLILCQQITVNALLIGFFIREAFAALYCDFT